TWGFQRLDLTSGHAKREHRSPQRRAKSAQWLGQLLSPNRKRGMNEVAAPEKAPSVGRAIYRFGTMSIAESFRSVVGCNRSYEGRRDAITACCSLSTIFESLDV
ncbi:MAG: hypothetical protein ACLPYS_01735, partial [Vulcanimicrobiaceae bacterium]